MLIAFITFDHKKYILTEIYNQHTLEDHYISVI